MRKKYFLLCILYVSIIKSEKNKFPSDPMNGFLGNLSKLTGVKSFDEKLDDFARNPENADRLRQNKLTYFTTHPQVLSSAEYATAQQEEALKLQEINSSQIIVRNNNLDQYTSSLLFDEDQYRFHVDGQTACLHSENGEVTKENKHYLTREIGLIYHTPEHFNSNCFKVVSQEVRSVQKELPNGVTQILPFVRSETSIITGTPTANDTRKKRNLAALGCASLLATLAWVNLEAYNAIVSLN
jgi:hypothetical protein